MLSRLSRVIQPGSARLRCSSLIGINSRALLKTGPPGGRGDWDAFYYFASVGVVMGGLSFAAIPLYRMFCEATAFTGQTQVTDDLDKVERMKRVEDRLIRVQFAADMPSSMQWRFRPLQNELWVHPGETALAFYTAFNPTDRPIIGISSYNLVPYQAAYYFTKIQCFCFEEQILNPGEQVDLPVFFYIDPDYVNDPGLENMNTILLGYTFYESKTGLKLPSPFDPPSNQSNWKETITSRTKGDGGIMLDGVNRQ